MSDARNFCLDGKIFYLAELLSESLEIFRSQNFHSRESLSPGTENQNNNVWN